MGSSKRWSRLRLGALAVLVLLLGALAYFVSKAAALNEDTIRANIVARLAAWSGGQVDVSGPIRLHYFPDFAVTMGAIQIAETPRLPQVESIQAEAVRVELGLRSLVLPEAILHRITLTDLHVALRAQPTAIAPTSPQMDARPLIEALRTMPVPEVVVVNGEINRKGDNDRETFSDLNVFAGVSTGGSLRVSGRMTWRKEKLEFNLNTRLPAAEDPTATVPLTLTLGGPVVGADLEGKLMLADGVRASGSLSLQIQDLRRFTRWAGLQTPDGRGLGTFEASGGFRLTPQRLGFDEGNFLLDGNRALGALALDFGTPRPLVSGTLAFSSFDAGPYLEGPASTARISPASAPPAEPERAETSLLHQLDLDLRLSTSTVQAPNLTMGQAAVSATVKAGRLMADFAILDLCNGNGNGRIDFDAAAPETTIRLAGNFSRISAQECLQIAVGQAPLKGNLDILVDAASKGRTIIDLLSQLDGRVDIDSGPGSVALDLATIASPARETPLEGWTALTGGATTFSDMRAALVFRKGRITAETLKIRTSPVVYSGKGMIDTGDGTIDMTIAIRSASTESGTGAPQTPAKQTTARIGGTWLRPVITAADKAGGTGGPTSPGATPAPAPVR